MKRGTPLKRRTRLRWQSTKRAAENRLRKKVAHAAFGTDPLCSRPGCTAWAEDCHEPLTRARGGSITDPANMAPLCRPHHNELGSEPAWAYEIGLLKHSWDKADDGSLRFPPEWGGAQ
jgi:hypothetical protein